MFTTYYISLHLWLKYSSSTIFYNSSFQGIHIDETFPHIFFCLTVIAAILGLFLTDFQKTQCEYEKYCCLSLSAFNLYDHLNYSPIMQVLCKASCTCIGHKLSLEILTQAFLEFCKKKKKSHLFLTSCLLTLDKITTFSVAVCMFYLEHEDVHLSCVIAVTLEASAADK